MSNPNVAYTLTDELKSSREMYYAELTRTENINGRINSNIAIFTAAASGEVIIWSKIEDLSGGCLFIYIILCIITVIIFIVSIRSFLDAYDTGLEMYYYPFEEMIKKQYKTYELARRHKITIMDAEEHIVNMKVESYTNCTIKNQSNNEEKIQRYNRLMFRFGILALSIMFTAIVGIIMIYISNEVEIEGIKGFLFLIF